MEFGAETSPTLAITPVKRPRQQVEDQLREAITSGTLRSGDRLPSEITLAGTFSVSRSTVREALRTLVSDGLIEKFSGSGGGSFVRALDPRTVGTGFGRDLEILLGADALASEEFSDVVRVLGGHCARLAAAKHTESDLNILRKIIEQAEGLDGDDPKLTELDTEFHEAVFESSGNVVGFIVLAALRVASSRTRGVGVRPGGQLLESFKAVVSAFEARDPDTAETAVLDYLGVTAR
ncbi:MAG TPA: FadR/GntR family transcriptional regulator [Pseudonocardia sp.]|jgi:DNA-binding FadR family transcriptional regulator|nr:FadR/GntR family transcriptional regulator [Pseudonocardia sp.]